jgi:hypothetical protein
MGIRISESDVGTQWTHKSASLQEKLLQSVSRRRSLFILGLCFLVSFIIFVVYLTGSLSAGGGQVLMPLDDTYIHFQYARQIAAGQPYIYNPGLPATSGATSFLYPYILAFGYLIGFQGLNLGLWAMLVGMVTLALSMWLIYLITLSTLLPLEKNTESEVTRTGQRPVPTIFHMAIALIFGLNGAVSWHFMSGMETGLTILFMLLTLYLFVQQAWKACLISAAVLALLRPEGGLLAMVVAGLVAWQLWLSRQNITDQNDKTRTHKSASLQGYVVYLILPVLALFIQPLVNWIFTGSTVASGNSAKSIFGMIPPDVGVMLGRIAENFGRMWLELLTGYSPREGWYLAPPLTLLALAGVCVLWQKHQRWLIALIVLWMLVGTAAVATLDPAFWHFKRYQMPLIALVFPLAAWGLLGLYERWRPIGISATVLALVGSIFTGTQFLSNYIVNVHYVYQQPLQMATWLELNTPEDAVVAVHDTGLMRYMGGRTTVDMVGLTTAGAADPWRNGPGAVAEFLEKARSDYIAAYGEGHGLGLGYLAKTDLYGEPLALFQVALNPNINVALAADTQGIYQPDWAIVGETDKVQQTYTLNYLRGMEVVDLVDVADIASEKAHDYRWQNQGRLPGFPTEVQQGSYLDCLRDDCRILDGGRLMNGEETFTLKVTPNKDAILVTRVHPLNAGTLDVYANHTLIDTRVIPSIPGRWLEIQTLIPKANIPDETLQIRIVAHISDGAYMPYYHWLYQGNDYQPALPYQRAATRFQNGAIELIDYSYSIAKYEDGTIQLEASLFWATDGSAGGDYVSFLHIYDLNGELLAQTDQRPGLGTMPPGNWLPGMFRDTVVVNLTDLEAGTYQVAVGLYDPLSQERLEPDGGDDQRRFFLDDLELPDL